MSHETKVSYSSARGFGSYGFPESHAASFALIA
jgi:DNA polymerase III alpha subunit